VKAEGHTSSETVWACLHGELGQDGRAALEREMAGDPECRRRFEKARRLDGLLRSTLPALATDRVSDDALTGQVLAAWESEQPAAAQPAPVISAATRGFTFLRRPAVGVAWLAAAAALVLAVSPALRTPGGVRWAEPVLAPLTLRGGGTLSGNDTVAPDAAARCQAVLSAALAKALEARGVTVPRTTLSLRLQELRRGAFSVVVTARQRSGRVVGEWSGDYSDVQLFFAQADASAARIAEALDGCGNDCATGGRP